MLTTQGFMGGFVGVVMSGGGALLCACAARAAESGCSGWQRIGGAPELVDPTIVADRGRGVLVLMGRSAAEPSRFETWELMGPAGADWELRAVGGPPGVPHGTAAYDRMRGETVYFGGHIFQNGQAVYSLETWVWNGSVWSRKADFPSNGRSSQAMGYDAGTGRVVMCGGFNEKGRDDLLWSWDGVSWRLEPTVMPPWTYGLLFDSMRSRMLAVHWTYTPGCRVSAFAGDDLVVVGETVTSDLEPAAVAYDESRGVVVCSGFAQWAYSVTWEFSPSGWGKRAFVAPMEAEYYGMTYDPVRRGVVAVGRARWGESPAMGTWLLDSSGPVSSGIGRRVIKATREFPLRLSVQATGEGWTYQWTRYSEPLQDGEWTMGATTPNLTIRFRPGFTSVSYGLTLTQGGCSTSTDWVRVDWSWCAADLNGDRAVDSGDLAALLRRFGTSQLSFENGDLDGDGQVSTRDLIYVLSRIGRLCPN